MLMLMLALTLTLALALALALTLTLLLALSCALMHSLPLMRSRAPRSAVAGRAARHFSTA